MPTLQLLQDVQTRLERGGGGGGKDREQRGRKEGGREKCGIETSMYGCVITSSRWQFIIEKQMYENRLNPSLWSTN